MPCGTRKRDERSRMDLSCYYARPNAIVRALPPRLGRHFADAWDRAAGAPLDGALKGALADEAATILLDLSGACDLGDLTEDERRPGVWFTYAGRTIFRRPTRDASGNARIKLPALNIDMSAAVRFDCMLSSTAFVNMSATKSGAFILGVITSGETFELIICAYVDRLRLLAEPSSRSPDSILLRDAFNHARSPIGLSGLAAAVDGALTEFDDALANGRADHIVSPPDGEIRERAAQNLFYMLGRHCLAFEGVHLSREVGTATGAVDFTVDAASMRGVLEFKLWRPGDSIGKLVTGLTVQMPAYESELSADFGRFVVVVCGEGGSVPDDTVTKLREQLLMEDVRDPARVVVLDGRRRTPASKRRLPPCRQNKS
jgi:hypothetical protein